MPIIKYFKPVNQPVLDKYGRILISAKRSYPLTEQDCFPEQSEPMMPVVALREIWEFFTHYKPDASAEQFFSYLLHLEKDVPLEQQRCNIKFFHKQD